MALLAFGKCEIRFELPEEAAARAGEHRTQSTVDADAQTRHPKSASRAYLILQQEPGFIQREDARDFGARSASPMLLRRGNLYDMFARE
jgi:hypothetical protein